MPRKRSCSVEPVGAFLVQPRWRSTQRWDAGTCCPDFSAQAVGLVPYLPVPLCFQTALCLKGNGSRVLLFLHSRGGGSAAAAHSSVSDRDTWFPRQPFLCRPPGQEGRAGWRWSGVALGGSTVPPSRVGTRRGLKHVPIPYRALSPDLAGTPPAQGERSAVDLSDSFSSSLPVVSLCRAAWESSAGRLQGRCLWR